MVTIVAFNATEPIKRYTDNPNVEDSKIDKIEIEQIQEEPEVKRSVA